MQMGFAEDELDSVCITFDKMDKIGMDGVKAELTEKEFDSAAIEKFVEFLSKNDFSLESLKNMLEDKTPVESLEYIMNSVRELSDNSFDVVFDLSLVRGQGYYTGTVFEVESIDFKGAVAGGGRYDKMIGKFTGQDTPACGFSIGFERIVMLLLENGYKVPGGRQKKAYLLEKKLPKEAMLKVLALAKADREAGRQVLIVNMKKNKKFQKEQLMKEGYTDFQEFYKESLK